MQVFQAGFCDFCLFGFDSMLHAFERIGRGVLRAEKVLVKLFSNSSVRNTAEEKGKQMFFFSPSE